jgi:hypothetical protein
MISNNCNLRFCNLTFLLFWFRDGKWVHNLERERSLHLFFIFFLQLFVLFKLEQKIPFNTAVCVCLIQQHSQLFIIMNMSYKYTILVYFCIEFMWD